MPRSRLAFTRSISPLLGACELTHLPRTAIDLERAQVQHAAYEAALVELGCTVVRLPDLPNYPDGVFVEDTAFVLPEVAVLTRPGAVSRRGEVPSVAKTLEPHRSLVRIEAPGTLDGGDVLVVGKRVLVGASSRSNKEGTHQLRQHLTRFGYTVERVSLTGCLHLKSAATVVAPDTVLLNPAWLDPDIFASYTILNVDPAEPMAANTLRIGDTVLCATAFPRTNARLRAHGLQVHTVPADELAKAEGALTCCSVLV